MRKVRPIPCCGVPIIAPCGGTREAEYAEFIIGRAFAGPGGYSACLLAREIEFMASLSGQMRYSIHDKTLAAKKARILINALVDCAKAGIKPSSVTKKMLSGISLYLECGSFMKENWKTYHRISDAAAQLRASGDPDWKRKLTFEHARPLSVMYKMLLDERATLTLDRAAFIIGEYPPVLVTMEEEVRQTKLGFKHGGEPEQRYREIPISGFSLRSEAAMPR
jgi:hypothetical protein